MLTITLPEKLEERLRGEAARHGAEPAEFALKVLDERLPERMGTGTLAELFAEWAAEDATDDPAEIRRRNEEFEELKRAMNESRREMEGPNARVPWP